MWIGETDKKSRQFRSTQSIPKTLAAAVAAATGKFFGVEDLPRSLVLYERFTSEAL
jgi:hypothetical protein